ncbi:hypothetical protein DTO013E5_9484 [Penicillium roqueforti]|uniref:Uncharacterized protein n=1 Tax=Penicillium roqueforti (strain FM164) TaxID=1365484 RepID=W6QSU6_PENRF|nr:uncharacterized protein LCP9604111_9580 [Penicillium roqueforti]CDM37174.1 unnamed protein product [Penicillium roqueforti FM164]KAF9238006.1 hypothetical protein LCP9604111_9580 [Penicillium roqueforti]KAI1833427.1 hypothetical protein CBS147337_5925 [Penicillium roqueforti]KAI2671657.1 hypothetical protein LCP963914a_9586 [Penicillium roqueforti]KAI2671781.1 hypothetical protein CBS147355_8424 [Penicillium roqueforti]
MSTSNDGMQTNILVPDDAVTLQNSGLVSSPSSDGTRRIHKRRLNRSSDEEEQHLPLTPVSISSSSDSFVSIPDHLVSLAALEHLGYNSETATLIWEYWTNWPPGEPKRETDDTDNGVLFIDVAEGHLDYSPDTCSENDAEWFHCMNLYGITRELQEAIMDPKFRSIRLTDSCKSWIRDTFQLRNRALQAVQEASRERDMASRREASRPGQSSSGRRSISDSLRMVPWLSHETALSEAATTAASRAPGHTTIYKGIDQALITELFDHNGNLDFGCLISRSRCDFSGRQDDLYFAIDREVAELYACYIKHRSTCSGVVIIHISIPNSVIESLSIPDIQFNYWPNAEWKSLIFHCRQGKKLPSKLRKYKLAKLIIGTICGKPNLVISRMRSPDEITEHMVLKTSDGRNAVQYVFKGDDGDTLLEECSSVTVFPLTSRQFQAWLERV